MLGECEYNDNVLYSSVYTALPVRVYNTVQYMHSLSISVHYVSSLRTQSAMPCHSCRSLLLALAQFICSICVRPINYIYRCVREPEGDE